ncbi:MAG: S8 family peptidase [Acidimicrobiales bacterium]
MAELDTVARVDVLPLPALTVPQLYGSSARDLPVVEAPDPRAPIVGIIDSGVQSGHPLIAPAVLAAEALSPSINEGEDEHGHGTMVAALLLHGNIEHALARGLPLRPSCKLVSVRVLGADNEFPSAELWETDLVEAIEWCAEQGARIVNLSIGDDRRRLVGTRQLSAAALVDSLARQHDLVIVVSSGNSRPHNYLGLIDEAVALTYPAAHLAELDTVIIDPASAMLALTVGGITTAAAASGLSGRESVARVAMGRPGWPSPITRRGPGLNASVKPEVVERAGTLGIEGSRLVDNDAELGVVSAGIGPDRLLASDLGTSFAAPLVARVAATVLARFPEFSSNLVRALVLLSTSPPTFGSDLHAERPSDRALAVRNLLGFGRPAIARAIESTSHRVVLVADTSIPIDGVHIYEIPVPTSFLSSGGERGIDVALAFDPPTRARRLDYLASTMQFYIVRGMPVGEVAELFAQLDADDEAALDDLVEDEGNSELEVMVAADQAAKAPIPPTISKLRSKLLNLVPSPTILARGANQLGRITLGRRLDSERHLPMFLVVRNVNHWDDDGAQQRYALAVALSRSAKQAELFVELQARLEAVIEVPVEIELET